ncbi:hypothetical protein OCAE111667_08955 [Occultella aeris]|uniref:Uncharacterized protein n=1 Tax=Occultella aeris TaxID=2761496 RepID=A0A7M4DJY6_9MICO|nr:hypothetical protein [Occultella aeris]VZO37373.1 hypothetical protein HALOF300_02448 [Occultella aeris]
MLTGTVTIDPQADLREAIAAVQEGAAQLGGLRGRPDLTGRLRLIAARRTP